MNAPDPPVFGPNTEANSDSPTAPENPYAVQPTGGNPYAVPSSDPSSLGIDHTWLRHLPYLGAGQIVLGVLEVILGASMIGFAFFLLPAVTQAGANNPSVDELDPQMVLWLQGMFGMLFGIVLPLGIFRIIGGISCLLIRGRRWILASLFLGLLSSLTTYCAPFSIGLCIYGAIVLGKPAIKYAFDLRKQGFSLQEAKQKVMES